MSDQTLMKKIGLGTVQFGMDYGIANKRGQIPTEEVFEILRHAFESGIDTLDTAAAYGPSEELIGQFFSCEKKPFKIVSKTSDLSKKESVSLSKSLEFSLKRLNQKKVYGYLVHQFENFIQKPSLWDELVDLKRQGCVEKIGFSLYRAQELEYLLEKNLDFDLIQVPYNIFDQRFEGYFQNLKSRQVEIHTRSVFLQGLFFMKSDQLSQAFLPIKGRMAKIEELSQKDNIPIRFLCLDFVMKNPLVDRVIIGIDSLEQWKENLQFSEYLTKVSGILGDLRSLKVEDEKILLPSLWKKAS